MPYHAVSMMMVACNTIWNDDMVIKVDTVSRALAGRGPRVLFLKNKIKLLDHAFPKLPLPFSFYFCGPWDVLNPGELTFQEFGEMGGA